MSLLEVGVYVTFSIISPEPEVTTMIHLHLICDNILNFNEPKKVRIGLAISGKQM